MAQFNGYLLFMLEIEPPREKAYNVVVRPEKTQSDQRLRCPHEESLGP